nr:hypothetical protein [Angustibacter aerolatus]
MAMTDRAAWERERAAAERLARAEQARLEKMLERLDARAPSRTRLTAQARQHPARRPQHPDARRVGLVPAPRAARPLPPPRRGARPARLTGMPGVHRSR